jgi:hypothetical protein
VIKGCRLLDENESAELLLDGEKLISS